MSKLKNYETMFILKPTLTEEKTVAKLDEIKNIFEKNNEEIIENKKIRIKELTYEIEKYKKRNYYINYIKEQKN